MEWRGVRPRRLFASVAASGGFRTFETFDLGACRADIEKAARLAQLTQLS